MKKYSIVIVFVVFVLCSCAQNRKNENLEFPKTTWDMSMDEVMEAWEISEEEIKDHVEEHVIFIKGYELFGEKTESVNFQFYDFGDDGAYELAQVFVTYPSDADMDHVSKEMQKVYGEPDPDVSFYYSYSALEDLEAYQSEEPDKVTNWVLGNIGNLIPMEEQEDYRERWEFYQSGLNEDNWDEFKQNSSLVRVSLLTDRGWNRVEFNAANQWIYETIKNDLLYKKE